MPWQPAPRARNPAYGFAFKLLTSLVLIVIFAMVAALVALILYATILHLGAMPIGALPGLGDESLHRALVVGLFGIAIFGLCAAYFIHGLGTGLRTIAVLTAIFVVTFLILKHLGLYNPFSAITIFTEYVVDPIRKVLGI